MLKKLIGPGSFFSNHGILHNGNGKFNGENVENNALADFLTFFAQASRLELSAAENTDFHGRA